MKLKYEMSYIEIDGTLRAMPLFDDTDRRYVLHLNGTTADILKVLEQDVTEDEIVSALKKEYDATEEQLLPSIRKVVGMLREYGLLTE